MYYPSSFHFHHWLAQPAGPEPPAPAAGVPAVAAEAPRIFDGEECCACRSSVRWTGAAR